MATKPLLLTMKILALMATSPLLFAAPWPAPTTEHGADYTVKGPKMTITLRLLYSPGKIRTELPGGFGTVIYRKDKNVYWTLSPDSTYVERPASEYEESEVLMGDVTSLPLSEELIDGHHTTKYKVSVITKKGNKGEGFVWATKENIVLKTDLVMQEGASKVKRESTLTNLTLGKVDSELFELPKQIKKAKDFTEFAVKPTSIEKKKKK
jgi:hypothetical protein